MKAYFFDLDGTLADTDADIRLAWKGALKELGLESPDFDAKFVAGPPLEEMFKLLFPDRADPATLAAARRLFGVHYDTGGFPLTHEYPGVLDRVRALKAAGARVYVVTNKRWAGTRALAAKFGWDAVFDGFYAGDMWADDPKVGKLRKPELLKRVLVIERLDPASCVMVGDTSSDFEAARANGVESVGVTWGYGKPAELALADRLVSAPADIAGPIGRRWSRA